MSFNNLSKDDMFINDLSFNINNPDDIDCIFHALDSLELSNEKVTKDTLKTVLDKETLIEFTKIDTKMNPDLYTFYKGDHSELDEFEDLDFDAIEYINSKFNTLPSLSTVNEYHKYCEEQIDVVYDEIISDLHEMYEMKDELPKLKSNLCQYNNDVMDRLNIIEKTSKELVDELKPLKDKIISLENQKANVLNSISETHKLKNFEDFLRAASKHYNEDKSLVETSCKLSVAYEIYRYFEENKKIESLKQNEVIKEVMDEYNQLISWVKAQVLEKFKNYTSIKFEGIRIDSDFSRLTEYIYALKLHNNITEMINKNTILECKKKFKDCELYELDTMLSWFKNELRNYEINFSKHIPRYWGTYTELIYQLMVVLKDSIIESLKNAQPQEVLLNSLGLCAEFEFYVNQKILIYSAKHRNELDKLVASMKQSSNHASIRLNNLEHLFDPFHTKYIEEAQAPLDYTRYLANTFDEQLREYVKSKQEQIVKDCKSKVQDDEISPTGLLNSTISVIEDLKGLLKTTITFANKRYVRECMLCVKTILNTYYELILVKYFSRPEIMQAIRQEDNNAFNFRISKLKKKPSSFKYYCVLKKSVVFMSETLRSLYHEVYVNQLKEVVVENYDLKKLEDLHYKISLALVYICCNHYLSKTKEFCKTFYLNKLSDNVDESALTNKSQEIIEGYEQRLSDIEAIFELMSDEELKKFAHKFAEVWGLIVKSIIYAQENSTAEHINPQIATYYDMILKSSYDINIKFFTKNTTLEKRLSKMDRTIFEKILQKSWNEVKLILDLISNYDDSQMESMLESKAKSIKLSEIDKQIIIKKIRYLKGYEIKMYEDNNI